MILYSPNNRDNGDPVRNEQFPFDNLSPQPTEQGQSVSLQTFEVLPYTLTKPN